MIHIIKDYKNTYSATKFRSDFYYIFSVSDSDIALRFLLISYLLSFYSTSIV